MEIAPEGNFPLYEITEFPGIEHALLEIGESEISRKICLEILRKRLKEQGEFHPCLAEDFLIRFLRNSKFDCTKAFSRIKKFYLLQKKFPDFFEMCSLSVLSKSQLNSFYASPYRMKDNTMLYISKFFSADPSQLPAKEKFFLDVLIVNELIENPVNQICGITVLADVSGFSLSRMFYYSPKFLKVYIETMQGAFPFRIRAIHAVELSPMFQILYRIGYPLLSKKLQKRFHVHSDNKTWKDLHSFVPPEILPEEYGGHLKQSDLINLSVNMDEKLINFRKTSPILPTKEKSSG